jgi:hypothetical protein
MMKVIAGNLLSFTTVTHVLLRVANNVQNHKPLIHYYDLNYYLSTQYNVVKEQCHNSLKLAHQDF